MNALKIILSSLVLVILLSGVSAQRRRPATRPAMTKPAAATPTPTPQATPTPATNSSSPAIAVVNDLTISASDIEAEVNERVMQDQDPYLRDYYLDPAKAIREARLRAVEARLGSMLVAAEAKKRGTTADALLEAEVNSRVAPPTEQEVRAAYEANKDQLGSTDLETVRPQLVSFLRGQRTQDLYAALLNRLKMTNVITRNADINAPNLASGTVIAAVNGEPLRIDVINERMKAYVYKMDMRLYTIRQEALDRRVNDLLIVAEASKRKVTPEEIIRTEINDKAKPPTEAEISAFYNENKARINGDLATVRPQISSYLQQQRQSQLEEELATKLRSAGKVQILLKAPQPPVMAINLGTGASRGDVNAAVTVVEFTDFQCSACGGMYPIVEQVLKSYGNRVHFVMRNFPLTSVHENAFTAAQAAEAAKAQGKFWEYIDLLFKNQTSLDRDSLKKFATQVGLDRKRFDAELDSGKYEPVVRHDMEEGEGYGIEGTPTFFINGVTLTEYSEEGLRAAIERAFTRAGNRP
jgi:protein-disulfide isomerase